MRFCRPRAIATRSTRRSGDCRREHGARGCSWTPLLCSIWGFPLADLVWSFDVIMLGVESLAFTVAIILGTPGCEIGVWTELIARARGGRSAPERGLACLIGLHVLDDWEATWGGGSHGPPPGSRLNEFSAELKTDAEDIEDATGRGGRAALQLAEREIDELVAAVKTFAGGYSERGDSIRTGGNGGVSVLTLRDMLGLATQVGRSARLQ